MSALPAELEQHALYRLWDESGELLYVGITSDPERRFHQHQYTKAWWPEVASITLEHYATGDAVAAAEADAIASERPRYNVRPGKPIDVRIFRTPGVGKPPMVKRTLYIREKTWEDAKRLASEDPRPGGANISDIVRELVEDYVRRGGVR